VITSFDDYPVHQTTRPVAHPATADLNHYDRYFFNGYTNDASCMFAVAMGLYPNRQIADAAFSVVIDGSRQVSLSASMRASHDRRDANVVGPITVEIVEPLRRHRILVDAPDHGVRADLLMTARSGPLEEPHFLQTVGTKTIFDYTRLTQFGSWSGSIEIDGRTIDVHDETFGSRDRSWGVRPVGERVGTGAPGGAPQFFWLWAPVNFPSWSTHLDVNEFADGRRWHQTGMLVEAGSDEAMIADEVSYELTWRPGTRRAASFSADLQVATPAGLHNAARIVLEPVFDFQMLGLGYLHPTRGHGMWRGELDIAREEWSLPVADPFAPQHVHVQTLCRATCTRTDGATEHGLGVLEQLVIGPHDPTGLTGLFDPAG
jgi:hypothetical protein